MSRSDPSLNLGSSNPAKRFIEWKGSEGGRWQYWDKQNEQSVEIPSAKMNFVVLDVLYTIKGYSDDAGARIWANEIRNLKEDRLTVRIHGEKQPIAEGYWDVIKDQTKAKGGNFCLSVYAIFPDGELINLQLSKSGLGNWFDLTNEVDVYKDVFIKITGTTSGKKGVVEFNSPVFGHGKISKGNTADMAMEADKHLQEYLRGYFQNATAQRAEGSNNGLPPSEPLEDLNHEMSQQADQSRSSQNQYIPPPSELEDEDSIPF